MQTVNSTTDDILVNPAAVERAKRIAERKKAKPRRRGVDPATTEKSYTPEELEFMRAMQAHKERTGRWFPTWKEVLDVLHSLGYNKDTATTAA